MKFDEGFELELGNIQLSEEKIIRFAQLFDPLEIHTNKKAAESGFFGRIVASGPHLFNVFYQKKWLPLYQDSILAGLEINNWKLLLPVFPDEIYAGRVKINSTKVNGKNDKIMVQWNFRFLNQKNALVQSLEMIVLHKIDSNK